MKSLVQRIIGASKLIRKEKKKYDGNDEVMISTGSTLLDLAISGGRKRGGGLPGGILVEIFGPSGCGKTVLLCEIAGGVQRQKGKIMFRDPEARLDKQFARIFDLDTNDMEYDTPDRVPDVFKAVREWEPELENGLQKSEITKMKRDAVIDFIKEHNLKINFELKKFNELKALKKEVKKAIEKENAKNRSVSTTIHGIFADSLAALSTSLEMDSEEGDKMGMRRAKEFSEETRKTCRIITNRNYLMVCSNQIRQSGDTSGYGEKYTTPGGEAFPFYASVRLKTGSKKKLKNVQKINGKEVYKIYGVKVEVEVYKNSSWKPYRTAPVTIVFDYGIDDIRDCLQYLKDYSSNSTYCIGDESFQSISDAIAHVEENRLEKKLKNAVIDRWQEIEEIFKEDRIKKRRE